MSFFGFDTTLPKDRAFARETRGIFENPDPFAEVARKAGGLQDNDDDDDAIDFEDTYDGLGDQLDDDQDAFNDDTFGGAEAVDKDFDFFGKTAQVSDVINEEQIRYNLGHPKALSPLPTTIALQPLSSPSMITTQRPKKTGYEKYSDLGFIPEVQAKSSVWGTTTQKQRPAADTTVQAVMPTRKILSLEEVEAQICAQSRRSVQQNQPAAPSLPLTEISQPVRHSQHIPALSENLPQLPSEFLPLDQGGQLGTSSSPSQVLQQARTPAKEYHTQSTIPMQVPQQILQNPSRPQQFPLQQRYAGPLRSQRQPPHSPMGSHRLPAVTNSQQLINLSGEPRIPYSVEEVKRAKRNHKIFLLSKGNGLMTPQDKNFITRIQLQQLVAAGNVSDPDPEALLSEDFYYQVYSQIRGAPRQHPHQPLGHFAQTYLFQTGGRPGGPGGRRQFQMADNHMQRMQQQVQRAVEAAKLKPKNKQLIIEGSLGKISFSNAKTPKPLLNIKRPESADGIRSTRRVPHADLSPSDRKTILGNIENVYSTLMKMEDVERTMPPPSDEADMETVQRHMEWRKRVQSLNQKLWQNLKVMEPIIQGSSVSHPFIAFLSYPKGKKAIPRIFRQINQEQRVTILTMIVVHLDSLDVVRRGQLQSGESQPPVAVREEIELFSQVVMPSLLGYVNEAPFNIIIGLLGLVLVQTHVQTVAKTKVGLGILTMLLSRAEIVKEAGQADERDWHQWCEKFNVLFDTLEPTLGHIFRGSINSGDDIYVWQFLAAVGIGANPEQQQRLVIAVKDRVMETVAQSKTLPADMASQRLSNVNLFMRAIGLDVELLG